MTVPDHPCVLVSHPAGPLSGTVRVPGDKSISHRALMLPALAVGASTVTGLSAGEDVARTEAALTALGVEIERLGDGRRRIHGVGVGGLAEPEDVLDLGNSGTSARLFAGLLASHPFVSVMTGDASLRRRPMARVTEPLAAMGARFEGRAGGRLPLAVIGSDRLVAGAHRLAVASAQVKSALLLAGLNTAGETAVIEPAATRDHTERMLRLMGLPVAEEALADGAVRVSVAGHGALSPVDIAVPGDPSAAAFLMVAAAIVPGSRVTIADLCLNPGRTGLIDTLWQMGADVTVTPGADQAGDAAGTVTVAGTGSLRGVDVPAERAVRMIDEYPILAVAAAFAEGETRMTGLAELRVKESDRLAAMADGLTACGVPVTAGPDSLTVGGLGSGAGRPAGGATVASHLDHRIAMSFLVMGMAARAPVAVDDAAPIATSFPGFAALMNGLGARLGPPGSSPGDASPGDAAGHPA